MPRLLAFFACALAAFAIPAAAFGGGYTLHPSGFGEHSYSAWKGQEGLPDSTGGKDQALYFQKMTSTANFVSGVAVFKGFEGLPVSEVWPLQFRYRTDGHCGAGAPRFNLRVQVGATRQTLFFGCNSGMVPTEPPVMDDQGRTWDQRTTVGPAPMGNVVSLSIVYDEGTEFPPGYVYLDNIGVGTHLWTSASDNGNGETITADPTGTDFVSSLLGESVLTALSR
jgi:hypothetical protein